METGEVGAGIIRVKIVTLQYIRASRDTVHFLKI
jgi:hypothetical protein